MIKCLINPDSNQIIKILQFIPLTSLIFCIAKYHFYLSLWSENSSTNKLFHNDDFLLVLNLAGISSLHEYSFQMWDVTGTVVNSLGILGRRTPASGSWETFTTCGGWMLSGASYDMNAPSYVAGSSQKHFWRERDILGGKIYFWSVSFPFSCQFFTANGSGNNHGIRWTFGHRNMFVPGRPLFKNVSLCTIIIFNVTYLRRKVKNLPSTTFYKSDQVNSGLFRSCNKSFPS